MTATTPSRQPRFGERPRRRSLPHGLAQTLIVLVMAMAAVYAVAGIPWPISAAESPLAFAGAGAAPAVDHHFRGCNDARAVGMTNIPRGHPSYREYMDGDGDGLACEPYRGR
jgi:hypothetical protein